MWITLWEALPALGIFASRHGGETGMNAGKVLRRLGANACWPELQIDARPLI